MLSEYAKNHRKVSYQFNPGAYRVPENEIKFNITGFDREELKVLVTIQNLKKGYNRLSLSEENFYNFLYQPQLFDLFGT